MRMHLLSFFMLMTAAASAFGVETKACTLEIEEMPYLRDHAVIEEMSKTARESITLWNLLPSAEGQEQLASAEGRQVALSLPKPGRKRMDAAEVYQSMRDATLVVGRLFTCGKCSNIHFAFTNTAFAISEDGYCVMNHHCLAGYRGEDASVKELHGFVVRTWDGRNYPVSEISSVSEVQDLAIVRVDMPEGERLTPLPLGNAANVGDTVYTLSHPSGLLYRFSKGMVTRNAVTEAPQGIPAPPGERPRMCISADYAVGSSGGPVVDERGNLVGVISTTRTLYANGGPPNGQPQMVEKHTVPVSLLRELIDPCPASSRPTRPASR